MATSIDLRVERRTLWERAKEIVDGAEAENRGLSAEEETNYNKLHEDMTALDKRIEAIERLERTAAKESAVVTPARPGTADGTQETEEQRKLKQSEAFRGWLLFGMAGLDTEQRAIMTARKPQLSDVEMRALSVGVDTAGGYLVPDDMRSQIEQAQSWYGGMRESGATIFQTDGGQDIAFPVSNDTTNRGRRIGENTTVTQTDPTVGQRVLRAIMYSSDMVLVPFTLLQDSAINVETWLAGLLAERIGRATNLDFTTGSGADSPTGVQTDSVSAFTAAATTAVTSDELIRLEHSVDRAYRPRARWMCNDDTMRNLRILKDGDGRYIFMPGMVAGVPNTLFGYQYTINSDLPNMATATRSILFGDFSRYYIRDVKGFTLFVLRERFADSLQIGVFGISRHDGKLVNAGGNPIQHITMA